MWDAITQKFLAKYFPLSKMMKLKNDIVTFKQYSMESLYKVWEHLKELLRACPHHDLEMWMLVQNFYNGLLDNLRTSMDVVVGGSIMKKYPKDAYGLLEEMTNTGYQRPSQRATTGRGVTGIYSIDAVAQ